MSEISILNQQTIDKIAAGEVIERPASVIKELAENAIDAKANAITVEIKDGGISFLRITDNGKGIAADEVPLAFLRHSTSKIKSVEDLLTVSTLGFRGEALSSIAAVSQVELITKTHSELSGIRYLIEGGAEKSINEIGAPEGTTFLVKNLFYNTPARKKFLKTPATEGSYISEIMERLALSRPEISFKFINNNQVKLHTSGNSNVKEIIYQIYGRDMAENLIPIKNETEGISVEGFIGKPLISRGNRNFEHYFINGRYIKSNVISKGIEDGYQSFVMQHKYPFTMLFLSVDGHLLDVNVHPTKMEVRFQHPQAMYEFIRESVRETLNEQELIARAKLQSKREEQEHAGKKEKKATRPPEPFEKNRMASAIMDRNQSEIDPQSPASVIAGHDQDRGEKQSNFLADLLVKDSSIRTSLRCGSTNGEKLLSTQSIPYHLVIGQLFDTYWLVQFEDKLYIIDQHAAHEKVLYERLIHSLDQRELTSQSLFPPILLSLTMQEEELLKQYQGYFEELGFAIEFFGGKEYSLTAVPANLFGLGGKELMVEILDGLNEFRGTQGRTPRWITEKIASLSCKAAVKGKQRLFEPEIKALIEELLTLENPYHCPHGRPTIISMSKKELEKKFKRIL